MSIYAIPPLFGSIAFFSLAYFVFSNKPRTKTKILFSILCLETLGWQICWFASFFVANPIYISYIAKIAYIPITFLPFTFYHFIIVSLNKEKNNKSIYLFYIFALILLILVFPTQ